ncbi:MAG TPA: hypothetical protein VKF63_12940 [Terracidiphilus sp.]|nr:hypothetical protein [Terracidiphilus sp.]
MRLGKFHEKESGPGQSHEAGEPRGATVLKGHGLSRADYEIPRMPALAAEGCFWGREPYLLPSPSETHISLDLRGFYETAGLVKVFVFAFVFSLVAFLLLLLFLQLPFVRDLKIHLGLLYALAGSRLGLGA